MTIIVVFVYVDKKAKMEESLEQMKVHTKVAVDGKRDRFKEEKLMASGWCRL